MVQEGLRLYGFMEDMRILQDDIGCKGIMVDFLTLKVPFWGVPILRIMVFGGLYWSPLFGEITI